MEHGINDGCAIYDADHELMVVGYREPVIADDIEVGDLVRDSHRIARGQWFEVTDRWTDDGDEIRFGSVHLALAAATEAEVAKARREACGGHETTQGAIGDTYYCDGTCV